MILYKDCGFFDEEKNDEYAPKSGECGDCHRLDICNKCRRKEALEYIKGQLDSGYLDLGIHDEYEMNLIKEIIRFYEDCVKAVEESRDRYSSYNEIETADVLASEWRS